MLLVNPNFVLYLPAAKTRLKQGMQKTMTLKQNNSSILGI